MLSITRALEELKKTPEYIAPKPEGKPPSATELRRAPERY